MCRSLLGIVSSCCFFFSRLLSLVIFSRQRITVDGLSGDRCIGTLSGHTGSSLSLLICLLRDGVVSLLHKYSRFLWPVSAVSADVIHRSITCILAHSSKITSSGQSVIK